jgi:hypothetical protein
MLFKEFTKHGPPKQQVILWLPWQLTGSELDLSNQGLTSIPAMIGTLKNLVTLKISKNSIKSLPPQLADLASLKTIDARDNILEEVPWQLSELPNLTSFLTDGEFSFFSHFSFFQEIPNCTCLILFRI